MTLAIVPLLIYLQFYRGSRIERYTVRRDRRSSLALETLEFDRSRAPISRRLSRLLIHLLGKTELSQPLSRYLLPIVQICLFFDENAEAGEGGGGSTIGKNLNNLNARCGSFLSRLFERESKKIRKTKSRLAAYPFAFVSISSDARIRELRARSSATGTKETQLGGSRVRGDQ